LQKYLYRQSKFHFVSSLIVTLKYLNGDFFVDCMDSCAAFLK